MKRSGQLTRNKGLTRKRWMPKRSARKIAYDASPIASIDAWRSPVFIALQGYFQESGGRRVFALPAPDAPAHRFEIGLRMAP